jgi:hypothetical protein
MVRRVVDIIWPVLLLWIVLLSVAFASDADWPETRRLDFALIASIATFDVLLASIMLRRMRGIDWLTLALSAVLITKSMLWFFFTGSRLWPEFVAEHSELLLWTLRLLIMGSLTGAVALLIATPDESYEQGRLAGVAEEQHDQHERELVASDG